MKIGIVGIGYWGKIILKTLKSMDVNDIVICDPTLNGQSHYETYPAIADYTK